jgi:hypothetical protein
MDLKEIRYEGVDCIPTVQEKEQPQVLVTR